jgi:hypothetical protein
MASNSVLKRLTLVPKSGLCNRLQAIASARRLCQQLGAKCIVVWNWGTFDSLFTKPDDLILESEISAPSKEVIHQHALHVDPSRSVNVFVETVELHSGYFFWGSHESAVKFQDIIPYIPLLSERLAVLISDFSEKYLKNSVGFHIRRTDNKASATYSPDYLFFKKADEIISSGMKIFLATDNVVTETEMKRRFGDNIITRQKRDNLPQRWPRPTFSQTAAEDDLIDLFLLSKTKFVIGSYWSSFSSVAIRLNGSDQCEKLAVPGAPNLLEPLKLAKPSIS